MTSSDSDSGSGDVLRALQRQEAETAALREEMRGVQESLRKVLGKLGDSA